MNKPRVLGVDACRRGWVGIAVEWDGGLTAYHAPEIDQLVDQVERDGKVDMVAVDMPIGLADAGRRQADVLARKEAGPQWCSVFIMPVREALESTDISTAKETNLRLAGEGFTHQAFSLRPKILQVDRWVRETHLPVVEVRPEVSFAALAGEHLRSRKSSWSGAHHRRELLARAGIMLPNELGDPGLKADVNDMLDAAAAAWTARRVSRGEARPLPDPPETFSDGLPCAIWI
ncbi:DUF429 domain-containing protein [Actinocorallia populi]|uniref:DUF429 domain-containing protein n=1 Tax=Actinocorallia populi TaxID=2079200 RepID=UPI000D095454|nr:DUF429 domain-containing protein [Actinocorallia populi]